MEWYRRYRIMSSIRVLIVDDHLLFRAGLVSLFATCPDFSVVGEASGGEEALILLDRLNPDLILLDVRMPVVGGLETLRRIRAIHPGVHVVMLTASEDENDLFEAIKAGAHGYILKSADPDDFFRQLHGVMQGEAALSGFLTAKILKEMSAASRTTPEVGDLTQREAEVLRLVAEGASNKEIATRLSITENTVKKHLRNILDKLHLQNRTQAATYALREGLLRDEPSKT
jgi:two-component system NarL family response regulator